MDLRVGLQAWHPTSAMKLECMLRQTLMTFNRKHPEMPWRVQHVYACIVCGRDLLTWARRAWRWLSQMIGHRVLDPQSEISRTSEFLLYHYFYNWISLWCVMQVVVQGAGAKKVITDAMWRDILLPFDVITVAKNIVMNRHDICDAWLKLMWWFLLLGSSWTDMM